MKKLNQNNTIATTAMLTKTNTMKNKMNFFAKVVMLVAMMIASAMQIVCMADVTGPAWGQEGVTWYIYKGTISANDEAKNSDNISIYTPNVAATCSVYYNAAKYEYKSGFIFQSTHYGSVRFFINAPSSTEIWNEPNNKLNSEFTNNNLTLITNQIDAYTISLKYGWTKPGSYNSNGNKTITVSIPVPVHCDVPTTSLDFGQVAINGSTTKAITLNSFLTATSSTGLFITTSNPNVFKIGSSSNTNSQETLCSGGNQAYSPYNSNSNYHGNLLNIYFTPTSFGTFNGTIYIHDGTTLRCSIPVTGTCTPTYTWTTNTTLSQNEVVDNAASISGYTGTIYYESSDRNVIDLLDNNNQIVPTGSKGTKIVSKNAGTATITASINESPVTSQCLFTVTNLGIQVIDWNQDRELMQLKMGKSTSPMPLTAVAKDKNTLAVIAGSNISYSSSNTNVVTVTGNQLTIVGPGEATLTATAPAITGQYVAATTTRQVKVKAAGDNSCTEFAISGVSVNSAKTVWFNGIYPDKLSFTAEWGFLASGTSSVYAVDGSGTPIGNALYTIQYNWTGGSESKSNIQVPREAAGLKFDGSIEGGRFYSSVTVTQASFMERLIESYDFGNGAINVSNTHNITAAQYSNLNDEISATITGENADQFDLNTLGYGEGCGEQGNAVFSVTFKPTSVGPKTATLHLSAQIGNNPVSCDITLTGNGTKLSQTITWNPQSELADGQLFSLTTKPDNDTQTNPITLTATTTARHGDDMLPITYTPSPSGIVHIEGDKLYIDKAGTVTITASQAGDATYEPAQNSPSYTLNISKVTPNLTITGETTTPEVFSAFQVSASSTGLSGGYSRASDGKITFSIDPAANTNATISNYSETNKKCDVTVTSRATEAGSPVKVVAHLAATDIYEAKTETLTVNATKVTPNLSSEISSLTKTALTNLSFTEMPVTITNRTDVWHDIAVTYSSSDPTIAVLDGDHFSLLKSGTCTITAKVEAGVNNNASSNTIEIPLTVNLASQSITWNDDLTGPYNVGQAAVGPLTATASSGMTVNYSDGGKGIVSIGSDKKISFLKAGYATITASQSGDERYSAAGNVPKSFKVDFATDVFLPCSAAVIGTPSTTTLDMSQWFVPSGSGEYTASAPAGSEFSVTGVSGNTITIQFSPTSVNNGDSDTEEKEATITITDNDQEYHFKVKATAEKKDADLVIADIENPIVFSTITPSLSSKATDETDVTYTYTNSEGTSTGPSYKFTSTEKVTIVATTNANTKFKAGRTEVEVTPAKVSPSITWSVTDLGSHSVSESPLEFTQAVMGKADDDPEISEWSGIAIEYQSSDESVAKVVNGKIELYKAGTVTITPVITGGVNNNAAPAVTGAQLVVTCWKQTITWDPTTSLKVGETVTMDATASGNTTISYQSGNTDIISNDGACLKAGHTTFKAQTTGNEVYCSEEATKDIYVDFADNTVKNCSTAMVMSSSTTTFNLNTEMVKSVDLKLESCSNSEFYVTFSGYDMNVTFTPTVAGERTADLAFSDDYMTYHLQLTATATAPTITFNPTVIGTASTSTNSLDISAITLTSLSSNGNIRLVDNGTEHVLPYNGTITGPLTFKYYPTEVETNAEHTLTVNGTYEIIYNVTSTQHTINFAETKVGVATAQQQFEMTNFVATGALTAYTSSSEFRINGARYSSSVPLTISNGATLNIDFSPRNTCDFNTTPAELIINDNGTLYKVNLTGKTEDLEPIDLGTVNIGQASEAFEIDDIPQTGTVTVTSTSPYVFRVFADDEEATLSTATANSSIDVSGKGKLYVKFYPETAGEQTATITISITDSYGETSSYSVNVSGTGVQQTFDVSSTMGQLYSTQIALTNMVSAEGYTVSLTTPEEFRINDDVVERIDVIGGSSLGIKLYPKTSGNKSETVTILDKSTNISYTINLTGTVTALPNLSFNQQKVAKTDVTDNKTITLSGWPENMYELDILDNSETSYAESFLIRGVAGISSLVNGENETVQFRPKKVFNTPLTLYAREKSSGILYPIAGIIASSIQNDEVQLVWSDNSDPIMIGMNDCSYGFAYAVGLPELNVFYSVSNDNITTCGDATSGIKSGESTPRNHYSGLQGVNNGATATVTAYILQSDEYLATPITRTFQVTDKLSQEIVFQYDTIVLTVGETFSLTDVNAPYAIDKVDKDATGAQISYSVNGGYISLNGTNLSVNAAGSGGYIDITAALGTYNEKEYLSATKRVWIIGVQEEICNAEVSKLSEINLTGKNTSNYKEYTKNSKDNPVGYMSPYIYELKGYEGVFKYSATLSFDINGTTNNELTKSNNSSTTTGRVNQALHIFEESEINSVKVTADLPNVYIGGNSMIAYFSGASLYQKKYFNKISDNISIDAGEAEQYSSTTTGYIEVANYSALNGIIRYRIVGPDAKSFKVVGTQTTVNNVNKTFTEIDCGDLSTAKVKIEFTPQRVGNDYDATLQLIASTTVSGTITYTTLEIPLSGTGTPRTQQISWSQGDRLANLKYDDYIAPDADKDIELTAYSSIKGQDVSYAFCDDQGNTLETDPTFVSLSGKTLTINGAGDTYIKATQAGKTDGGTVVILPADPVILHIIVAKADPKLKWNSEYTDDWMYVFGTETIAAHSEPIEGNTTIGSTGGITYSTITTDLADCTEEGSLKVNKYGEVTIKAIIAEDDNYLGGEEYAITKTFKPKKVTPVINWAEGSLGNYKQDTTVTLENDLAATISKSTDEEPDVTLWSDDIAIVYSSLNTQIATVNGNVVSLNGGKKGVVTIQADVPVGANGNNIAAESKTRTMKVDFAGSDIRDCGTAAVLASCSTTVNLSDEIITASNSTFSYIESSNSEFTGSITSGVLTVTFTPASVKESATQKAVITIKDNNNNEEYHINVKGTATLHQGSINYITTAGHWTFQANAGTKTLTIASNGDIWGDQDEMNGAITLSSDKEDNVTVSGNTITIVGGDDDTDDDVTVTLTASFPGSDRIAACSTDITLTIQKLASGLALNKAELNNNAYVYSTIAMLADGLVSDGDLNIEVTPASTHEVSDGNKITLKSCVETTITATTAGTTIYKSGNDNVTFTPKKVTPVVTWNGDDFTTDLSNSEFTLTDAATVTAADGQPDVSLWDEDAKTVVYSSSTPEVATLKSGETNTFELHKVGYATIQAQVNANDNINLSNPPAERHLKVDFNPDYSFDLGTVSVYAENTKYFDLNNIVPDGKSLVAAKSIDNYTDFTYLSVVNDQIPIVFKPQSHDEDNPTKSTVVTIHDYGNGQDYHLTIKGTTALAQPSLKYDSQKHDGWEFVVQLPNTATEVIYGGSSYDIQWNNFPNPDLRDSELGRMVLSLKNPVCSTYVDIIDHSHFVAKQANEGDDNSIVDVVLVATYPGIENQIAGTSIEIPIKIKKNQYSLNWNKTDGFSIEVYQHSLPLAAPTQTPEGGESVIEYSFSEEGIGTYDGSTFTLIGPPYKSGKLTASIASDKYAVGTSAELDIKVKKTEQTVTWAGNEITNGFTTQKSTTEGIQLTAEAFRGSTKTNANIRYEVFENSNCSGEGALIRLDVNKEEKPWITTLYYTGNGSGTVSIQAIAEETDEYNESKADDPSASPTVTFGIIREGCNVNSWTVADMYYGDKVTLAPSVDKETRGENYEYTLPPVTGELTTDGNVLEAKGVGSNLTILAKKLEDCWVNESEGSTASNTFNIAKSEQKIEWSSQPDISAAAIGDVEHQLALPVAKDKLHTIGEGTWLSTLETGLEVTYDIDQTAATKCSTEDVVVIEDGKLKITGRGSGTVTITAQQTSGSEYYEPTAEADEKSIIVTISKITPTITISGAPTGNVDFGTAPMTITAQAVLNGNVVKDYQDIELYTLANNKIVLTSNAPTTVSVTGNNTLNFLKSGSATITATIEADCIVKNKVETTFTVTVDRATQVLKWESWPAGETKSITTCDKTFEIALDATTTDVSGNPTGENNVSYEIVSTSGNCNENLAKIEDNKLTYLDAGIGSVEIKAVVAQSDKYSAIDDDATMHRTFVINRCSTDVIVWDGTELNNVHYNDVIVPNADFSELSKKASDKGSISYSVTRGPLSSEFKATGVGTAEITATTGANCYSTGATMAKSFTIQPTTQEIVWTGTELNGLTTGQYANGGKVIELTAKSYDTGADHNHEETGLDIHYEISDISGESGCENFVMLDPNDNHKLIVTGTGAGTFKITASQKGKDGVEASGKELCYEAATDVTIDVTISKITPTISFEPQNSMNYGDKVEVTASSALEGIYSSGADENNGITITSGSNDEISISEGFMEAHGVTSGTGVTLTASQADNCVVSGVNPVSENVTVVLGQQKMVWNGKNTASIDVAGTQTFTFNPYAIDKLHTNQNGTWLTLTNGEYRTENTVEYVIGDVTRCESSTEVDLVSVDATTGVIRATGKGTGTVRIWAKANADSRYAEITDDGDKVYIDVTVNGVKPAIQSFDISSLNSIHYGDRVKLSSPKTNYFVNQGDNKTTFSYDINDAYDISAIGTDTMFDAKAVGTGYTITATQEAIACFNQASEAFTSSTFNIAKSEQEIEWNGQATLSIAGVSNDYQTDGISLTAKAMDKRHKAGGSQTWLTNLETGLPVTYTFTDVTVEKCGSDVDIISIDENGKLTATGLGSGTVTITATQANGNENYSGITADEDKKSITVTVNKITPDLKIYGTEGSSLNGETLSVYYGDPEYTALACKVMFAGTNNELKDATGNTLYSIDDIELTDDGQGVVTIGDNGISFNKEGVATITATLKADCRVSQNLTATFYVNVQKPAQEIKFEQDIENQTTLDYHDVALTAYSYDKVHNRKIEDLAVSYAISTSDGCGEIATYSDNTVHVTGLGAGTVTITASQAGDDRYGAAQDVPRTFTIDKETPTVDFTIAKVNGEDYSESTVIRYNDVLTLAGTSIVEGTSYDGHEHVTFKYNDEPISSNQVTVTDQQFTLQAVQAEDCIVIGGQSEVKNYSISNTPTEIRWTQTIAGQTTTSPMQPMTLTAEVWDTQHNVKIDDATVTFSISGNTTTGCGDIATLSDENLLTVTGNGAGTVTLTASYSGESGKYDEATSVKKSFTITKADPQFNWAVAGDLNATYGDNNVTATTTHYGTGTVTYVSSKPTVATIDQDGNITIVGAGTTTLSATLAADCKYEAVTTAIEKTLTVAKAPCTITVTAPQNITFGQTEALQYSTTNTDQNLQVTFTSGNTNIVSISGNQATGAGVGTTYVYAEIAESDNYLYAKSDDFNITVTQASKTFTIADMSLTYGDQNKPVTITDDGITGYTVSYSIDDADKSYIVFNQDGTINAIGAHCDAQGNLVNIPVTASFTHANYTIEDATFNVTVAKKSQTITWNETFSGSYDILSEIKFNATTDADASATNNNNKVYYTWTQNSTCDAPVFGHRIQDNIIDYNEDKGALILAAGDVIVTAHYTGNENYLPADCNDTKTFTINKVTPKLNWETKYTDNQSSGTEITLEATSNYIRSDVQYEIVSMTVAGCASLNGNKLTCNKPGEVIVRAFQKAIPCVIDSAGILQTIKIGQGPHVITWDKNKTYSVNNLAGTIDLSDYCKCSTCSTCLITYSIPDGTTGVSLNADGHTLIVDESISETLNVEVTARVAEDNTYEASSNDTTFIITVESLTITVNGGSDTDNPLDLSAAEPYVTSVTDNVNLAQKLVDNEVLSSNYKNVTYTFASDDTNIATFNTDYKTIIAYKRSDALKLTVTATVDENRKCSIDFWVKIPRGTMVFNRDGNWGDMLSDGSNWQRRDLIPTKVDHNVRIAANCTVNVATAECYDMEIADNGTLTISTSGILNVANTLSNSDASKLVIAADANGQGTLIFHNSTDTDMPQATVEMWCKGSEAGTAEGGGNINPNWQYRGIAVSQATLTENAPDLIYQWTEAAHASDAGTGITEQWTKVTDNTMSAWTGYAVAKYTSDGADYKTLAAGALTNDDKVINLAYTATQQSGNGVQTGFNLITNSYTAPIRISDIVFGDETEGVDDVMKGIVLFNTGKYVDWKNSDKGIREGNANPGQYLFLPKYTAEQIATTELIPSGESFFVVAYQTDKTVQIPYSAVDSLKRSGPLKMPERREVYGKLIIEVDGGEGADRLYLLENENRVRGFENGYDGPKYAGTKGNPMLYATTDDGRMCVSADSSLLGQYIGFAAGKHDVTYTMTFDASALSGYSELYLYDTREKRYTNILDGGTYTFKGLVSGEDRRFKIVGSREDGKSVTGDDQTIIVTGNRFHVTGYDNADERIYLVDMTGKILWETSTAFGPWFDIPTDIPAGVYVIKTGNHTAKMAVK